MKRLEKITRLSAVGFSPTELGRMPNHVLDATYASAKPLLEMRRKQINQVRQEGSMRRQQAMKEVEWSRTWSNPRSVPICTVITDEAKPKVITDADEVKRLADFHESERRRYISLHRNCGDGNERKEYAEMANKAMMARNAYEETLKAMNAA